MGFFDAILDLTLGEEAGTMHRLNKAVKDVEKAEYAQKLTEERRHQEILAAIRGSKNTDDDEDDFED
jgi:hypothetical protein